MMEIHLPFYADDKGEFGLFFNVVFAFLLAQTRQTNLLTLCIPVLFHIGFGTLEDDAALLFLCLSCSACQHWLVNMFQPRPCFLDGSDPKDG